MKAKKEVVTNVIIEVSYAEARLLRELMDGLHGNDIENALKRARGEEELEPHVVEGACLFASTLCGTLLASFSQN